MLCVGLTGGIGSGKSTVAAGLARRGARVIDADGIARQVVQPDGPAYAPVVERFGSSVLRADGTLDRPALAAIVFSDPVALADLNRITHPVIGAAVAAQLAVLRAGAPALDVDRVVVLDQPLLTRTTIEAYRLDVVVVVDTPTETAIERLVRDRGFGADDARARVGAQMLRAERLELADVVIDNTDGIERLDEQIDRLWADLLVRAGAQRGGG